MMRCGEGRSAVCSAPALGLAVLVAALISIDVAAGGAWSRVLIQLVDGARGGDASRGRATAAEPTLTSVDTKLRRNFFNLTCKGQVMPVRNLGVGIRQWTFGFHSKPEALHKFTRDSADPDQLVVFIDGSDVMWGGCSWEEFLGRYNEIVRETGRKIVFSAERHCFDPGWYKCRDYPRVPAWATRLYNGTMMEGMRFMNSGLLVGPAGLLRELTACVAKMYAACRQTSRGPRPAFRNHTGLCPSWGDQGAYNQCWQSPHWQQHITLDYGSRLALSLEWVTADPSEWNNSECLLGLCGGRQLCFVHGNGMGKALVRRMMELVGDERFRRVHVF